MPISRSKKCIKKTKSRVKKLFKNKKTKSCSISRKCYNNFNIKMSVSVINCSMHKDRLSKFRKYSEKAGLKACRVPCVKGKKFTNNLVCDMIEKNLLKKTADMDAIEVSINISHYNCWKKIVNSCYDYGIVMEDDVEVHEDFIDNINLILEKLEENEIDFSILHCWNGNWNRTLSKQKKILKINNKLQILKETVGYNAGAVCYIISREYAEFLIKKFFPIKDPNDILMGSYPKHGNHLTLKMKFDKKQDCYISPILDNPCGGEEGTGDSTRVQNDPVLIKEIKCKKC
jgi:GR25 family glycosyltransferase involved in LPS biosynthesis